MGLVGTMTSTLQRRTTAYLRDFQEHEEAAKAFAQMEKKSSKILEKLKKHKVNVVSQFCGA